MRTTSTWFKENKTFDINSSSKEANFPQQQLLHSFVHAPEHIKKYFFNKEINQQEIILVTWNSNSGSRDRVNKLSPVSKEFISIYLYVFSIEG